MEGPMHEDIVTMTKIISRLLFLEILGGGRLFDSFLFYYILGLSLWPT